MYFSSKEKTLSGFWPTRTYLRLFKLWFRIFPAMGFQLPKKLLLRKKSLSTPTCKKILKGRLYSISCFFYFDVNYLLLVFWALKQPIPIKVQMAIDT